MRLSPTDRRERRSPDSTLTTPDAAGLDKLASLATTCAGRRARAIQPLAFPGLETVRPTAPWPGAGWTLRPVGWRLGRLTGREGLNDPRVREQVRAGGHHQQAEEQHDTAERRVVPVLPHQHRREEGRHDQLRD